MRFVIRFSRPMAPSSASRANFSLSSGSLGVGLLTPRVDPVERAVIFPTPGPPALEKNTQYTLSIRQGGGDNALVAYDGAAFEGTTLVTFTTADDDDVTIDASDVVPAPSPCAVYQIFTGNCTGTYCHGGGTFLPASNTQPAMGLNLLFPAADPSNPQGFLDPIQLTAVGHPSIEAEDPSNVGGTPVVQPRNFPVGMAIIAPGASAASYLMYKILMRPPTLGSNPAAAYIDPTVPDLPNPGQTTADDVATRMFGQPMPDPQRLPDPTSGTTIHTLKWTDRQQIREWIDEGAHGCACKNYNPQTFECPPTSGGDAGVDGGSDAGADAADAEDAADGG